MTFRKVPWWAPIWDEALDIGGEIVRGIPLALAVFVLLKLVQFLCGN